MNTKVKEMKSELKDIAKRIKATRITVKDYQRENNGSHGMNGFLLRKMQSEFRHKHIAYCLYKGKTMDQIEKKNRVDNAPDMRYIDSILNILKESEVA